jgi:hypothetical protein
MVANIGSMRGMTRRLDGLGRGKTLAPRGLPVRTSGGPPMVGGLAGGLGAAVNPLAANLAGRRGVAVDWSGLLPTREVVSIADLDIPTRTASRGSMCG